MFVFGLRGEIGLKYLIWYFGLTSCGGVFFEKAKSPGFELVIYIVFLCILFALTKRCQGDYSRFKSASPNVLPYFEPTPKQRVGFFWFDLAIFVPFGLISTALLITQVEQAIPQPLIVVASFSIGHLILAGLLLGRIVEPPQD
jgi:hypothetical protein